MTIHVVAMIGALILLVIVVGLLLLRGRRGRHPAFSVRMADAQVYPCDNPRADWFTRCELTLVNHTEQPIQVSSVVLSVEPRRGKALRPKEVCGAESKHVGRRHHPPHLATCLPISVPGLSRRSYTLDAFFEHGLRRMLPGAELCAAVNLDNGRRHEARIALPAPAEGS